MIDTPFAEPTLEEFADPLCRVLPDAVHAWATAPALARGAEAIHSSLWAFAEFHAVVHRHVREGAFSPVDAHDLCARFSRHVEQGLWTLVPVNDALLRRTSARILSAPRDLFLRTADAVHLMTAQDLGARDVWTNERHMLVAAAHFGLSGRSV